MPASVAAGVAGQPLSLTFNAPLTVNGTGLNQQQVEAVIERAQSRQIDELLRKLETLGFGRR